MNWQDSGEKIGMFFSGALASFLGAYYRLGNRVTGLEKDAETARESEKLCAAHAVDRDLHVDGDWKRDITGRLDALQKTQNDILINMNRICRKD